MGNSKGHHFIRLAHGGGVLTFVAPRDVRRGELAIWFLAAMTVAMITILGAVYLFIRKTLNPLHTLKAGVNEVGAGRLDHRIPETGSSELRDLAQAFNSMAERLNRLLHSKEQLLLDVSHELRSPITRLKVQLEFLDDADARESLRSDLAEMEAMVAALLESARLRHTAAALSLKSVNMGDLIRSLVPEFKDRRPGVEPGPLVDTPVNADPEKMRIVLRNLLDNALKHTPEDGPAVSISMALKPDLPRNRRRRPGRGDSRRSAAPSVRAVLPAGRFPFTQDRRIWTGAEPVQGHRRCPRRQHRSGQHPGEGTRVTVSLSLR